MAHLRVRDAVGMRGTTGGWLSLIVVLATALHASPVSSQTTGFNQSAAGPYDYNTSANWVGGSINGLWDSTLTLAAAQTAQFAADTTLTSGLTFNYNGGYGLTLNSTSGTRNVTLGGDLAVGTVGGSAGAVTIGNATNILNLNLGGVTRTATVSPFRTLTLVNAVSNGGLIKAGSGTLALNGANTFTGGVSLGAGTLSLGAATALGTSAGTFTIADGTSLNSTVSNLVLSSNNAQVWNGNFTFLGSQNLNLGTGAVTLGASPLITTNANTLTVGGAISGAGLGITKGGAGTLQLSSVGKSTFDGGLVALGGTLRIDFANSATPASGLVADANTLTLRGGDLTVVAKNNAASAQTLGGVTIDRGRSVVTVNGTGSGTMNLTTGAWTRNAGATLNVVLGTGGTLTSAPTLSNGIIGPWATFNTAANTRYATVSSGVIASSTGTVAADASALTDTTGTVNYDLTAATGTMPASMSANTIRYAGAAATTAPGATLFSVNGLLHAGSGTWTIGTNALTIGDSRELVVNTANNAVTISGIVKDNAAGSSALVKDGSNTLTLSVANTYSGGTTLNSGILLVGSNSALGTGTLTINGGEFGSNGFDHITIANAMVWNGNFNTYNSAKNATFNGAITIATPLTIRAANGLTINGAVSGPGGLNALDITGTQSGGIGYTFTVSSGVTLRGTQTVSGRGIAYTGVISDGGAGYGITAALNTSDGNMALGNANTFTGPLTIESGTVQIGNGGATGSLSTSAAIVNHGTLAFNRTAALTQGTDFASVISGAGAVRNNGGTTVLNGSNTYLGVTTVAAGTLSISTVANAGQPSPLGSYPFPSAAGVVISSNGTLRYTGATAATDRGITISGDWGTQNVNVLTAGTALTLGSFAQAGGNNDTLRVTGGAGSSLTFTSVALPGNTFFNTDLPLAFGTVTGAGGLTKQGTGTLTLASGNTFAGGVTLGRDAETTAQSGVVSISADSGLGTYGPGLGTLTFNNGTLQFAAGSSVTLAAGRSIVLNASRTGNIDTSLAAGAVDSVISGSGGITKIGANALTLNASNIHTGTTKVSAGSVKLGVADALKFSAFDTTGANVSAGIGLDINGFDAVTTGGLSGNVGLSSAVIGFVDLATLTLNPQSGTVTYSGALADGGLPLSIIKNGGGTQVLSGTSALTGSTTVNAGLLRVTGLLPASSLVSVAGGGIGGSGNGTTTGVIGGSVTLSGTGAVDLRDAAVGTLTIGGNLTASGSIGANPLYFDLGTGAGGVDKIVVGGGTSMTSPGTAVISVNPTNIASRINAGTYTLIQGTGSIPAAADFKLPTSKAFGLGLGLSVAGNNLQLVTSQLAVGPTAPAWTGATDATWNNTGNWSTAATPSYQSNVSLYSAAANLSTTLGEDFDVNSLGFPATATSTVTIGGSNTLTIEATTANGNAAGNGITVNTPSSGTVAHAISANVGLAADQTWTVNPSATLTVSGSVTDFGLGRTLSKAGTGSLTLDGGTSLGGLSIGLNTTGGSVTIGNGATLRVGSGPANNLYVGHGTSSGTRSGILDASAASGVIANVGNLYVSMSYGATGKLSLGATNTLDVATLLGVGSSLWDQNGIGYMTTAAGFGNTTTIRTPTMWIGYATANGTSQGNGTVTIGTDSSLSLEGVSGGRTDLFVGYISAVNGAGSNSAVMDLSPGSASLNLRTLTIGARIASNTTTGVMTLGSSATNHLDVRAPGTPLIVGYVNGSGGGNGTLTIGNLDGTSSVASVDNSTAIMLAFRGANGGTGTGTLNLNGGTLGITTTGTGIGGGGGTSTLNLNGATLKAGASSSALISALTNARMYAGGLTVDTAGNTVTLPQVLSAAPGGGFGLAAMTTLTPMANGSGYTTPPTVTFNTPAGGTPATGIAQINAAGQVTGILVTNPGSGYSNGGTASITLTGGGGAGATFTNPTATFSQTGGGLTKTGSGRLSLTGTNTYTGATTILGGVLSIDGTGAINSSPITINGGTLNYNSSVAYLNAFSFTAGTLGGTNLTGNLGGLTIGTSQILSPGNSPGTAATTSQTWAGGGSYVWEINDATGTAGVDPGWDLLTGSGALAITATGSSTFTIDIRSLLLSNAAGVVSNFDANADYKWKMADFSSPVTGFDPASFTVTTSGFANPFGGQFGIALGSTVAGGDETQLYVTYNASVIPEPASLVLVAAAAVCMTRLCRSRRRARAA